MPLQPSTEVDFKSAFLLSKCLINVSQCVFFMNVFIVADLKVNYIPLSKRGMTVHSLYLSCKMVYAAVVHFA